MQIYNGPNTTFGDFLRQISGKRGILYLKNISLKKQSLRIFNGPCTNLQDFKHILVGTEIFILKTKKIAEKHS